jgi:valyl-tRNA synthetase
MSIEKTYNPGKSEKEWYQHWLNKNYFHSEPDARESYTVMIPPPNVTGVLHMGHMLNNTIQDVLVRRARMLGKNACWVPGTDHASIATEAKVVQKLRADNIKKSDLSRDEFLSHAWEWKEKHGGIILDQLKRLGASCDWERTNFTLNPEYSKEVIDVFIDLHKKGKVYRGLRMINWDPSAKTALSDEEVIHKEVNSKLYHVRYKIEDSADEWITIATTRPETILGDSGIAVNSNDARYHNLVGKSVIVPIANRAVPIIADDYVEMEFGTGCLKITPAHDTNDNEIGKKHNLETIDILNDDGTLNEHGLQFEGQDRFEARKAIAKELEEQGYMVKVEDHVNKVGYSERTDAVIEPKLSYQWFVDMKKLSEPALEHVMNGDIKFHPAKFKNTYKHWMENIKDWCISRQLWWGHRIPAWYCPADIDADPNAKNANNHIVIAKTQEEATSQFAEYYKKSGKSEDEINTFIKNNMYQDEDVLDTWFSSMLWPISNFDGLKNPGNDEIKYYYPTNDIVTAPEIMFFWVARMIIAGYEYMDDLPFKNVYFTGIVRDKLGRKMSKSLGNSPDPIKLIEEFGADGVRVGILISSPAGNDLPFDTSQCEQGRNFTNKMWNAFRLIKSWEVQDFEQPEHSRVGLEWFSSKFSETLVSINHNFDEFRISDSLMSTYKLVWDDFCSSLLEIIKPGYQQPIDKTTFSQVVEHFENILKLVHPFTPFIAEEIWHLINERKDGDDVIIAEWPKVGEINTSLLETMSQTDSVVSEIRTVRKNNNIAHKTAIEIQVKVNSKESFDIDSSIVMKSVNATSLTEITEEADNAFSFVVKGNEYFVPFHEEIDVEAEITKLNQLLERKQGFLKGVVGKLSNERFVNNAPEQVVAVEKKKQADAEQEIEVITKKLAKLMS